MRLQVELETAPFAVCGPNVWCLSAWVYRFRVRSCDFSLYNLEDQGT